MSARMGMVPTLYRLYLYRWHMRIIHRVGWHQLTRINIEGECHDWCEWCGWRSRTWYQT